MSIRLWLYRNMDEGDDSDEATDDENVLDTSTQSGLSACPPALESAPPPPAPPPGVRRRPRQTTPVPVPALVPVALVEAVMKRWRWNTLTTTRSS